MILAGYLRSEEDNFEVLVIQDEVSEDTVEFQRALEFDDQDRELGQDIYCVVRNGMTYYGGVEWWNFDHDTLTFRLSDEAGDELELPDETKIHIDSNPELIEEHLPRILSEVEIHRG